MRGAATWLIDVGGGPQPYAEIWGAQRELLAARQAGAIPDLLILVEHRPVVTLGRSADRAHLLVGQDALAAQGIDLFEVERGGSATYHGPGQLVGYPILDLRRIGEDVGRYMRTLEATIIDVLAAFGLGGERRPGYPGVWVGGSKICAMGVAIKRRVTMHGFALNVSTPPQAFDVINPCGLGLPVTSMTDALGRTVDLATVRAAYPAHFSRAFEATLTPTPLADAVARARAAASMSPAG